MRHVCRRTWIEACVRGAECDFTGEDDARKPFYAFGRESKGVKRQERGDIFVEYQRCKMHGTYSFWGNQPNSSDLIPRAIIIGKATI